MPKAYSGDLRERVIEAVAAGASRREAAERFEVSVASAVKWLQRWRDHNSATPKPRGGSVSPLEEFATEILAVVAKHPDLTLLETIAELRKQRIRTSHSSLWRFLDRHNITALVTDVRLGGSVSGWDVSKRIRERGPAFPVVYVTNAPAKEWASQGVPNSI